MDTRQLEYFVAVAEELNFTKAAQRLFAVQSTVSAGIRSLERELGAPLFERSTKRVSLTSAGVATLPEARAAIEAIDRVRTAAMQTSEGIRGRLRVGIFTNIDYVDLPATFGEFHSRYPLVDVQLGVSPSGSTGLADDVLRGRVDAAFMGLPLEDLAGFHVLILSRSEFVAIVPATHRFADRESISLAELSGERWVDSPAGFGNRIVLERGLAAARLTRVVTTETADLGEIPRFVAAGLGVAVVPAIHNRPTAGAVTIPLTENRFDWMLSFISRPKPSPAVAALLELLERHFSER